MAILTKGKQTMKTLVCLVSIVLSFTTLASDLVSKSPEGAEVFIISPKNDEVVKPTFTIEFGIKGMDVSPAGIKKENSGHHHLLVDGEKLPSMDLPLGSEVTHFGKGQTKTTITLSKGKHSLQLILGNYLHVPHDPAIVSKVIKVIVKDK